VRWGLENLNLTAERLKQLGFENELKPVKVSCEDHNHVRLVHQRRQRDRAHGQGGRGKVRGREEDHDRLPVDALIASILSWQL